MRSWIFTTFSEGNVRAIAEQVMTNEDISLEMLPSYNEVMKSADMRVEAFSLMRVRSLPSNISLSKDEVKALIEEHEDIVIEKVELPGLEGPGIFADLYPAEG